MKQILLTIRDEGGAVHRLVAEEVVDVVIAALGAEPDTWRNWSQRWPGTWVRVDERRFLRRWPDGVGTGTESRHACVVDLPGRLVLASSAQLLPEHDGLVTYVDRERDGRIWLGYGISTDWLLTAPLGDWEATSRQRRQERAACRRLMRGPSCMVSSCRSSCSSVLPCLLHPRLIRKRPGTSTGVG